MKISFVTMVENTAFKSHKWHFNSLDGWNTRNIIQSIFSIFSMILSFSEEGEKLTSYIMLLDQIYTYIHNNQESSSELNQWVGDSFTSCFPHVAWGIEDILLTERCNDSVAWYERELILVLKLGWDATEVEEHLKSFSKFLRKFFPTKLYRIGFIQLLKKAMQMVNGITVSMISMTSQLVNTFSIPSMFMKLKIWCGVQQRKNDSTAAASMLNTSSPFDLEFLWMSRALSRDRPIRQ